MIEPEDYIFPRHEEPPSRQPTKEEQEKAAETLAYLENLPWRPFDCDW